MLPLTRQERRVVVFLMVIILSGAAISYIKKQSVVLRPVFCFDRSYGKVNINTADKDTLKGLPGVGETIARRIIEYRGHNGPFGDIETLRNIKGLNRARFDRLKDAVCAE